WIETLQRFLSRFSERAARGLGNYAEREGERIIEDLGQKITGFADFVGTIENPKAELLKELRLMYAHLQEGDKTSIEEKVEQFFQELQWAQKHPEAYNDTSQFLNNRDFPVLLKGLSKLNVPLASLDPYLAGVAGAEIMQGVETFLRQQGIAGIKPAPQPSEFDFFDPLTWDRGILETFNSLGVSLGLTEDKFEQVRENLPAMLSSAHEALPTSGKELKDKIYTIAENICALHKNGHSATDIVQSMFPGIGRIETQTKASSAPQRIIEGEMGAGSVVGLVVGGVAVFYFGASIIYIPIAAIGGMALGAVTGTVGLFRFLKKQAGKNP
ncbi:MAG: hypothetical protein Q7R74_01305, partial [bacterium]|nr:hypothetical protein [bacterium]